MSFFFGMPTAKKEHLKVVMALGGKNRQPTPNHEVQKVIANRM